MSKKRRVEEDEDVLELRDQARTRLRAMIIGLIGLALLVIALSLLSEVVSVSLDQQEELIDRLDASRVDHATPPAATTSSPSSPMKT